MQPELRPYQPPYYLLKESRESWENTVSNELVYVFGSRDVAFDSLFRIAKDYLQGNVWIEIHLTFVGERNSHAVVMIEHLDAGDFFGRQHHDIGNLESNSVDGNSPMLVDIAQQMKPPEEMISKARGIASTVRLKGFHDTNCLCGYPSDVPIEPPLILFCERKIENRELGSLGVGDAQLRERPGQLIEGRTETIQEISERERDRVRRISQLKSDSIQTILKIVFTTEGVRLLLTKKKVVQLGLQRLKMFVRPTSFEVSVGQAGLLRP